VKWVSALLMIVGVAQVLLGLAHARVHRFLGWPRDLQGSTEMTRMVSYVHTFYIGLMVVALGVVEIAYRAELLHDVRLGRAVVGFATVVWVCRLGAQLTVFRSPTRNLRHGAMIQRLACVAWLGLATIHGIVLAANLAA
jgi:hypothetical protein